jgi:glycosyltransferase involved in cell wall biosynthesis
LKLIPGISVIICCYNSEKRIIPTLEHLAKQQTPEDLPWEIVLVDNCCTDKTISVALESWSSLFHQDMAKLTIVEEKKAGLSNARKTGVFTARYTLVCFCDDDNWLNEYYITTASRIMAENPEIGILAGRGLPVADIELPEWFYRNQDSYACGELADESGDVTDRKWVWGAGMVLRNEYIRQLYKTGFTHISYDRKGASLSSGGDTEICYWHVLTGKKLWYDRDLEFYHKIASERLTKAGSEELFMAHEKSFNELSPYFPLIFSDSYQNTNKLVLFFKALKMVMLKQDGKQLFVHLRPLFDGFIDTRTIKIMDLVEKFKSNQ